MPPKNSERSSKFREGHKVIHRTAQRAFFRVVTPRTFHPFCRVWKGIFGIRDLTKIRCGNRENDKYIDGIRDLTVPRKAGLAKNWARDAGFMFACLSGMPETFKNTRKFKISIERINLHLTFISFCRN